MIKDSRPATRGQRFAAAALNLVIGMLPLSLTNILFDYGEWEWTKNELLLDMLALTLSLLQVLFVHKMQGSPGAVFVGLRVQCQNGSPLKLRITLMRSVPYLAALLLIVSMPRDGLSSPLIGMSGLLLFALVGFIAISGITSFIKNRQSLLDRITRTEIVKAYSIFPSMNRHDK